MTKKKVFGFIAICVLFFTAATFTSHAERVYGEHARNIMDHGVIISLTTNENGVNELLVRHGGALWSCWHIKGEHNFCDRFIDEENDWWVA